LAAKSPPSGSSGPAETLADVLASGPLPLAAGLRCAHEVATELRDLHQQARAYGNLTASNILMSDSGARLMPSSSPWDQAAALHDIRAFGAVFYQMLTATWPSDALPAAEIRVEGPRTGAARLRSAALMLALNCRGSKGARLSMQQLATEIRLLGVLLRQYEANAKNAPVPGPFLVAVAPPSVPLEQEALSPAVAAAPEVAPEVLPVSVQPPEAIPVERPAPAASGAPPVVPLGRDSFGRPTPKAPADRQPAGGRCPKCDSPEIYVSRPRSPFERMLDRWGVPLCRCHRCYHRYVVFARIRISKDMPATTERKFRPRRRHA
jgi:hypothetical protein